MDNLRSVLSIVLSKIPPGEILSHKIQYDNITKEKFVRLAGYYVKNYSNDELENLFSYMQNEYEERADYVKGFGKVHTNRDSFNIFDAILLFAVRTLQESDGEPVCQYEHMLRWRMTSHELDEDVFTTAFLAYKDVWYEKPDRSFSWRPVIRHNNTYLNKILAQGMADNHFHLKGSAPQFPLSWVSMMNNVTNSKFHEQLEIYGKKRLSVIYSNEEEGHLYIDYLKAALIRCYLFSKLTRQPVIFRRGTDYGEGDLGKGMENAGEESRGRELCSTGESEDERIVRLLLNAPREILFYRKDIQQNIRIFKTHNFGIKTKLDYAMCNSSEEQKNVNDILAGERWFMYHMFRLVFSRNQEYRKYYNMFYAYLVIKETIRSELVQTNSNIGFDNFEQYQDRKEDFIENTPFEAPYVEMALKGTLENQNILALEARITPKNTAAANRDYIRKVDGILCNDAELKKRYFYVLHFIKERDYTQGLGNDIYCRHYEKRKKLRRQALAVARFRVQYPKEARRVRGIDACSKEIGCRPEVFSQTYRFLRNHIVYPAGNEALKPVHQLALTYHVGEDYVDIIDGLRAVDEAVCFLQLDCGSRLGHGLALGVDVDEYYSIKNNRILIKQQDYLDNLVWLYYRIKRFGLRDYDDLLLFIEQEYSKYFRQIYGNFVCDDFFNRVMLEAREHFRQMNRVVWDVVEGYCNTHFYFRISEYYAAWKLRGDDPECYKHGYFQEPDDFSEWNRYAVNRNYPGDYKIRYNPECAYLYYLYHYCSRAKEEGERVIEAKATPRMVACVKEIQREMKKWIAKIGIGIEANPSSNYLIGSFKRYDKHPIFDFYNIGLTTSQEELYQCPQLLVCINTDDQGIFSTYLENEYALLALALGKAKDEMGQNKYNRTMIYQWIDNVRKQGLNLSFSDNPDILYHRGQRGGRESL